MQRGPQRFARSAAAVVVIAAWAALSGGCATTRHAALHNPRQVDGDFGLPPDLVMLDPRMLDATEVDGAAADPRLDVATWEYGRNDAGLGSPQVAPGHGVQYVEIRQYDFLRTINGRAREFSTTSVKTIKRGLMH